MGGSLWSECCSRYLCVGILTAIFSSLYVVFIVMQLVALGRDAKNAETKAEENDILRTLYFQAIVENTFFAMFIISYLLACNTVPASPLDAMKMRAESSHGANIHKLKNIWNDPALYDKHTFERKRDGHYRMCSNCNIYKPDRTHHDRKSGHCVLKMDHFCPWLNNTVGFNNSKYFFLTLFYGDCALVGFIVFMFPKFMGCFQELDNFKRDFIVLFAWFFAVLFSIPLTWFFFFHCRLTANAYTTIEHCEKKRAPKDQMMGAGVQVNEYYRTSPYDCGLLGNIQEMLGPNPLLWIIPTYCGMRFGGDIYFNADEPNKSHCDLNHPFLKSKLKNMKQPPKKS